MIEEKKRRLYLSLESSIQDLDNEIEWLKVKISHLLDWYIKITWISTYLIRWWNKEMAKAKKIYTHDKNNYNRNTCFKEELFQT